MEEINTQNSKSEKIKFNVVDFYKKNSLWFNCVILAGLYAINCFLPYFTFIAHALLLVFVIICEIKTAITYLFFAFAFNSLYLPYSAMSFGICVAVMMIRLVVMKAKESKENFYISKPTSVLYILFFVYLLIPFNRRFDFVYFERSLYLLLGAVLIYIFARFPEEFRLRYNLRVMLIGILVSCGYAFFHDLSSHLQLILSEWWKPNGFVRFGALLFSPNTLGMFCMVAITIYVYYIIKYKAQFSDVLMVFLYLLIGIFTLSRSFFVLAAFNLIVLIIAGIKYKSKSIGSLFVLLLVGVGVLMLIVPDLLSTYVSRFKVESDQGASEILSDLTSSRTDLWITYLTEWKKSAANIVFGKGLSTPIITTYSPHNMYITMLYQLGIIGSGLFISLIVFVIKDAIKGKTNIGKAAIIPLVSVLLLAFVEDLIFYMF